MVMCTVWGVLGAIWECYRFSMEIPTSTGPARSMEHSDQHQATSLTGKELMPPLSIHGHHHPLPAGMQDKEGWIWLGRETNSPLPNLASALRMKWSFHLVQDNKTLKKNSPEAARKSWVSFKHYLGRGGAQAVAGASIIPLISTGSGPHYFGCITCLAFILYICHL